MYFLFLFALASAGNSRRFGNDHMTLDLGGTTQHSIALPPPEYHLLPAANLSGSSNLMPMIWRQYVRGIGGQIPLEIYVERYSNIIATFERSKRIEFKTQLILGLETSSWLTKLSRDLNQSNAEFFSAVLMDMVSLR